MSYAEKRKEREEGSVNLSRHAFDWEQERTPLLHDGFQEACTGNPSKGVLFVSFWFANGSYRCRIQDRQADEKAFLDVGTLDGVWERLEKALAADELDWSPDHVSRNGHGSR